MPALAAAAAISGTAAAAAYLDAKFHLSKDVQTIYRNWQVTKDIIHAAKNDRFSLFDEFAIQVERQPPDAPCLWSRAGCYTWRDTLAHACRYGHFLLGTCGVRPGELVAVYQPNGPEFVFSLLGCWAVGCAPALVNYHLLGDGLVHCLRLAGAKALLVDADEECRQRVEESRARIEDELGIRIVVLDEGVREQLDALPAEKPDRRYRQGMKGTFPMCLLYTSGSTGLPKACPFPVHRAFGLRRNRPAALGIRPGPHGDRWYNCMPLYHGTGCTVAVTCLLTGITLCIGRRFSASGFWDDVRAADATAIVYVGETARYLLAAPPSPRDRQHRVRTMFGNGLRPDVWTRFQDRFGVTQVCEFFNSTEGVFALMNICRGPFLTSAVGHHGALLRLRFRNTYVPVAIDPETEEIFRDPTDGFARRQPYYDGGEILVALPDAAAFVGYWRDPAATGRKLVRNVFRPGDCYYRTGDALRRDRDGRWFFLDRLGDSFRWKGENVSTAEVAACLGRHRAVAEAIVYGVRVPGHDGRAGCAALHLVADQAPTAAFFEDLLRHCRAQLPRYAVPVFLRLLPAVNPLHNHKPNKAPLKRDGIDPACCQPDRLLWWPAALGRRAGDDDEKTGYVDFTHADWEALRVGTEAATAGATAELLAKL